MSILAMRTSALALLFAPASSQDIFLEADVRSNPVKLVRETMHKRLQMLGMDTEKALEMAHDMATRDEIPVWSADDWDAYHHPSVMHPNGFEVKKVTYTSPKMNLATGKAHFTINPLTHSPFPKGDYSLLHNAYRVMRGDGVTTVPLSEMYLHHWLMGSYIDVNPLEYCQNDYYWGYGAEMRNMDYRIPDGYAMKRIGAKGYCGLNMHFIRTDDLKLTWKGFNDPAGNWGAAIKNCIECGYAPNRAIECLPELDGTFACCFTASRCPVNSPLDKSTESYRLQYDVEYTEDLTAHKPLRGVVMDVSGGAVEWNIYPNMSDPKSRTYCDDKLCNTKDAWTIGHQKGFGDGLCSGTMLWSYTHQHIGAVNSTMFVNGEPYCTTYPVLGTDETNPPGNEKGYVVKFTECVSRDVLGNDIRLDAGDVVEVSAWYDVDAESTTFAPLPSGKHGGIMGLFFAMMDCDPGTFGEVYVCRQNTCVPTYKDGSRRISDHFKTIDDCQASCS